MQIPIPNAFTINLLADAPFPLGYSRKGGDRGSHVFDAFPVRLVDLADLIEAFAQPEILLFDVNVVSVDAKTGRTDRLQNFADAKAIASTAYDAAIIKIGSAQLRNLLEDLPHYDMQLLDLPKDADEDAVLRCYVATSDNNWSSMGATLPKVSGPRLYVDIHDDCYLHLEAWQENLPRQVLGRMLTMYFGTIVYEEAGQEDEIQAIPVDLLTELWRRFPSATSFRHFARLDGRKVSVDFSDTTLSFRENRVYPVVGRLCYDLDAGHWALTTPAL